MLLVSKVYVYVSSQHSYQGTAFAGAQKNAQGKLYQDDDGHTGRTMTGRGEMKQWQSGNAARQKLCKLYELIPPQLHARTPIHLCKPNLIRPASQLRRTELET